MPEQKNKDVNKTKTMFWGEVLDNYVNKQVYKSWNRDVWKNYAQYAFLLIKFWYKYVGKENVVWTNLYSIDNSVNLPFNVMYTGPEKVNK